MGAPFVSPSFASLAGLQFLLPSTGVVDANTWTCPASYTQTTTMGGSASHVYNVTFRVVGVVEIAKYTGGTTTGFLNVDGTPVTTGLWTGSNIYKLTVSDPAHTYYLNQGPWDGSQPTPIGIEDYDITIPIRGGATVTISADSGDGFERRHTLSVSGITSPAQPYVGQWIDLIVLSIT
jgi:hypothetical protein